MNQSELEQTVKDLLARVEALEGKKAYGNQEINKVLDTLKLATGMDDFKEPQKLQRQYGLHLTNLLKKIGKEEFRKRLNSILADDFKQKNCNSLKYIYGQLKAHIDPRNIKKIKAPVIDTPLLEEKRTPVSKETLERNRKIMAGLKNTYEWK